MDLKPQKKRKVLNIYKRKKFGKAGFEGITKGGVSII